MTGQLPLEHLVWPHNNPTSLQVPIVPRGTTYTGIKLGLYFYNKFIGAKFKIHPNYWYFERKKTRKQEFFPSTMATPKTQTRIPLTPWKIFPAGSPFPPWDPMTKKGKWSEPSQTSRELCSIPILSISPACHPLESLVGFTSPGNASRRINSLGVKSLSSSASDGWRTGWETTRTNQRCLFFFWVGRLFGVYVYMYHDTSYVMKKYIYRNLYRIRLFVCLPVCFPLLLQKVTWYYILKFQVHLLHFQRSDCLLLEDFPNAPFIVRLAEVEHFIISPNISGT